ALGRSPEAAIAAGNWFGHSGAVRGLLGRIRTEAFGPRRAVVVVGTGGNAPALAREDLFDLVAKDLVLRGLLAWAETRRLAPLPAMRKTHRVA
ncbi:MAG: hypothetical protein ACREFX_03200, partial [Opitutaceae bacterium]